MEIKKIALKYFLSFSNKSIVFLLLIKIWTDVLLPKPYKDSNFVFFIFVLLLIVYFNFGFSIIRNKIPIIKNIYIVLKTISISLIIHSFSYWILVLNIDYINDIFVGYWVWVFYSFLILTFTYFLLIAEDRFKLNFYSISTFLMVVFMPIGAFWIHKRLQKLAISN